MMTLSPYSFGSQQQNQSFKMENISVENIPNNKGFAFIWDLKTINNTDRSLDVRLGKFSSVKSFTSGILYIQGNDWWHHSC